MLRIVLSGESSGVSAKVARHSPGIGESRGWVAVDRELHVELQPSGGMGGDIGETGDVGNPGRRSDVDIAPI